MLADALSQMAESIGTLSYLPIVGRPLALDIQSIANKMVRLGLLDSGQIMAFVGARSSLLDQIRG